MRRNPRAMEKDTKDHIYALLADDDGDDRLFFEEAIMELQLQVDLRMVKDGMELMNYLHGSGNHLPQILFLDLNMPFKNGFQCLEEIRGVKTFDEMIIVLYSTTARPSDIEAGFLKGANLFIHKPNSYSLLKQTLYKVLTMDLKELQRSKENFVFRS